MHSDIEDIRSSLLSKKPFDYLSFSANADISLPKSSLSERTSLVNEEITSPDYVVAFSSDPQSYCVSMVDMVNSTKLSSTLTIGKVSRYYQIFLNSMSKIVTRFGGAVIKNVGDSLLYYFPESSKSYKKFGFVCCLECSLAMIEARPLICEQMKKENLPNLDFRISSDYGSVVIMKSNNSFSLDMIGPSVNICTKINHNADINGIIIGSDFYERVKAISDYCFKSRKSYSIGFKHSYPTYSVTRKQNGDYFKLI